jgi:hypothetical protein
VDAAERLKELQGQVGAARVIISTNVQTPDGLRFVACFRCCGRDCLVMGVNLDEALRKGVALAEDLQEQARDDLGRAQKT